MSVPLLDTLLNPIFEVGGDILGEVVGSFASRGSGSGGGGGGSAGASSSSIAKSLLDSSKADLSWKKFHKAVDMSELGHMPPPEARQVSYFREIQELMSPIQDTQVRRAILQQLAKSGMSSASIMQYAKSTAGLDDTNPKGYGQIPLARDSSKPV